MPRPHPGLNKTLVRIFRIRRCGCLFAAALLLLIALGVLPLLSQLRWRRHAALQAGLAYVLAQDETREKIGGNARLTGWIEARVSEWPSRGDADFVFTLSGPHGRVRVYLQMVKELGIWSPDRALLQPDSGPSVDISPTEEDAPVDEGAPLDPPEKTPVRATALKI